MITESKNNKKNPLIHIVKALNHPQSWDQYQECHAQKNVVSFPDIGLSNEKQLAKRRFSAENHLYFHIRKACKHSLQGFSQVLGIPQRYLLSVYTASEGLD